MQSVMRFACLLALLTATAFAGDVYDSGIREETRRADHHVKLEVEADRLAIAVRVTLRGKDRAALDMRLDAIKATLIKRFENQEGYEAKEIAFGYARSPAGSARSSFVSKSTLFGDEDNKGDTTYEATASWDLTAPADRGAKSLEILRAKAGELVNPKTEGEKQLLGDPRFAFGDVEGFRNDLLDAIKGDFEEVKKHLPAEGEYRLELPGLEKPIAVTAQGGRRFLVELPYRIAFVMPAPEKAKK